MEDEMRQILAALWAVGIGVSLIGEPSPAAEKDAGPAKPTLVVYDFESPFDKGALGRKVAEVLRGHAARRGAYVQVDPLSFEEIMSETGLKNVWSLEPAEVAAHGRRHLEADLVIWGALAERARGWDITFKAMKTGPDAPELIYSDTHFADDVHKIPLIVETVLRTVANEPDEVKNVSKDAERRWRDGPNMVANGGFEGAGTTPAGWEKLKAHMTWVDDPDGAGGKCLRWDMPKGLGNTYGMLLYSDWIPVEPFATYRFSVRARTTGPSLKIFIKCYEEVSDEFAKDQRRECYRAPIHCKVDGERGWKTYGRDFVPRIKTLREGKLELVKGRGPRWCRVMLYAYIGAGTIHWDDVVLKKIADPPAK
jgi:hypothetical protein